MKLKKLIDGLEFVEYKGCFPDELLITSVTNDSRKVKEGSLFVAIKGYLQDGHDYIEMARKKGAAAAIVTEFREDVDIFQVRVQNARETLSALSAKLMGHPTRKLRMVGITATNGKTTTSYILDHIYSMAGYRTGLIGSVVIKVGDRFVHSELTTPESSDLQLIFSEMVEEKIERTVMEVSSSALELYRVHDVDFDIVAFNNFSREHIDQHGSLEKYYEAKSSLVRNAKEGAFAVLNMDDEATYSLRGETKAHVVSFSTKDDTADLYCSDLDLSSGRANFLLKIRQDIVGLEGVIEKGEYPVSLMVPGFHSVVNSLSAMAMALIDGVSIREVISAVETFGGVERRFQYIFDDEFIIIDDHFANASNIDMTLESLVKLNYNKLHLVYAIRGNRGPTVNRENITTLLNWRDRLHMDEIIGTKSGEIVTSKDKVTEEEIRVFHEELEKSDLNVILYEELKEAIYDAIDKAQPGDVVLLAGSQGMDHGARVALEYIYEQKDYKDKEKLFAPLKGRVSDMAKGFEGVEKGSPGLFKRMKEKILGIIGGMGPEATAQLYMKIIKATKVKKDQEHFRIVIDSNPKIPDRTRAILGLGESPVPYIIETANNIKKMGADIACIPCITSHYFYDEIAAGTDLKIIHALEELNLYIHREFPGTKRIGVLATTGTRNTRIFDKYLKDVSIIYPDDQVQEKCVMEAIYGEGTGIKSGITDGKPVELLKEAGEHVIGKGAEVVILGCTEIGLVLSADSLSRPSIDPMDVMALVMIEKGREV